MSPQFYNPGPGEYKTDRIDNMLGHKLNHKVNSVNKKGFGFNSIRFEKDDTLPPGPGTYN